MDGRIVFRQFPSFAALTLMHDSCDKHEMGRVRLRVRFIRKICRPQLFERNSQFSKLEVLGTGRECAWQLKVQKMTRRG